MNSHQTATRLINRVKQHFGNISHTKYWIEVAVYEPCSGYNVFFNTQRPHMFSRSYPVGEYDYCDFDDLIKILKEFSETYHFTIEYAGFTKEQNKRLYQEHLK